jgi:large conductance mechanosensitive channel
MLKEFRDFAVKGNVMDLAVAVIIGAAFGTIVTSLVKDLVMPPIGLLLGHVDFTNLTILLKEGKIPGPYASLDAAQKAGAVTLNIGLFLNAVLNFLVVGFSVFLLVKIVTKLKRKEAENPTPDPTPSEEVLLLTEIRDLLKSKA